MLEREATLFVSGHRGLVGSAVLRRLQKSGFGNLLTATRDELDLRDPAAVDGWFARQRPDYVIHVAGLVGGIAANAARPADFLYDNMMMHATVLRSSWKYGVQKLLYLGSSCIYPRDCPQPIRESYMLSGPLEVTNRGYAIAKIAGVISCQAYRDQYDCNFISAMPTNLYGPGDNFDLENSHVLPALLRKFHESRQAGDREVVVWGSGTPRREFLFVDDLADACLFLMDHYDQREVINVGTGKDVTIRQLAECLREIVHPAAQLIFDASRPDGTPQKLLDVSRIHDLGWHHAVELREGITATYAWYVKHGPGSPPS